MRSQQSDNICAQCRIPALTVADGKLVAMMARVPGPMSETLANGVYRSPNNSSEEARTPRNNVQDARSLSDIAKQNAVGRKEFTRSTLLVTGGLILAVPTVSKTHLLNNFLWVLSALKCSRKLLSKA